MFKSDLAAALRAYDRHVVCLEKSREECQATLASLMEKAIHAYLSRAPGLRHGIALDRHITIILSQTEGDRPLCGIYFNLRSPYQKKPASQPVKAAG
jgi:hypothetical protein